MSTFVRLAFAITALSSTHLVCAADLPHRDTKYMSKTAQGLMAEVEMGKMAQTKAADERVKQFGKRMVEDHGKDLENLKQLASQKNVTLPASPDRSQKKEADKLSKLSGKDFDREYVKYEVKDHKDDVEEQGEEMKKTADPELKKFASAAYDTVSKHKESIDELQRTLDAK